MPTRRLRPDNSPKSTLNLHNPRETCDQGGGKGYNLLMQLAVFVMRLLEVMFFAGLVGSTVVVLISFVEDGIELFGKDEPPETRA